MPIFEFVGVSNLGFMKHLVSGQTLADAKLNGVELYKRKFHEYPEKVKMKLANPAKKNTVKIKPQKRIHKNTCKCIGCFDYHKNKRRKNPGAKWHSRQALDYERSAKKYLEKSKTEPSEKERKIAFNTHRVQEHIAQTHRYSAKKSREFGINPRGITKIYDKTLRIEAQKGNGSHYKGEKFYHDFKGKSEASIFGLPDGSLLIKSKKGKRLWGNIKQK